MQILCNYFAYFDKLKCHFDSFCSLSLAFSAIFICTICNLQHTTEHRKPKRAGMNMHHENAHDSMLCELVSRRSGRKENRQQGRNGDTLKWNEMIDCIEFNCISIPTLLFVSISKTTSRITLSFVFCESQLSRLDLKSRLDIMEISTINISKADLSFIFYMIFCEMNWTWCVVVFNVGRVTFFVQLAEIYQLCWFDEF